MSQIESQAVTLRLEIERLKIALQTTNDDDERYLLHTRLNECIRKSMQLIDQRIEACNAALTAEPPAPNTPLLVRHAGEVAPPRSPQLEGDGGESQGPPPPGLPNMTR
jgi:hypothetical protein